MALKRIKLTVEIVFDNPLERGAFEENVRPWADAVKDATEIYIQNSVAEGYTPAEIKINVDAKETGVTLPFVRREILN